MTSADTAPHPEKRVAMRIGGKLISFRIEEGNLEEVDRIARAKGIDRSKWIRAAILNQLVQERIAENVYYPPLAVSPPPSNGSSESAPPPAAERPNRWG